jgi:hypothetical protein
MSRQVLETNNIVVQDVLLPLKLQQHVIASLLNSINHRYKSSWYTMGVLVTSMHGYSYDRSLVFDLEQVLGCSCCYPARTRIVFISRKCTIDPVGDSLEFSMQDQQ